MSCDEITTSEEEAIFTGDLDASNRTARNFLDRPDAHRVTFAATRLAIPDPLSFSR